MIVVASFFWFFFELYRFQFCDNIFINWQTIVKAISGGKMDDFSLVRACICVPQLKFHINMKIYERNKVCNKKSVYDGGKICKQMS